MLLGTFNEILGYFVPAAVFFLGLSAAAVLVLPRPADGAPVFRAPLHPLPIALFLVLIVGVLALFVMGQPRQTMIGAVVLALGVPVSFAVIRRPLFRCDDSRIWFQPANVSSTTLRSRLPRERELRVASHPSPSIAREARQR